MKKLTLLFLVTLLFTGCKELSQNTMANEAEKQTTILAEQNLQLKRIADALEMQNHILRNPQK